MVLFTAPPFFVAQSRGKGDGDMDTS